jgi:membrane associated rhomboid family serine protease
MIGGSNGVSSLLGYFIARFPYMRIYIFPIPIPIPAWFLGIGYFYFNYKGYANYDSVGYAGHLSGFLTGLGYYYITK